MNDVYESLPALQENYKNYNLLLPISTDVQLNPFYKYHVATTSINPDEEAGEVVKTNSNAYYLRKCAVNRLAGIAGVDIEAAYGERIDRVTYRGTATVRMRNPDGVSFRRETDSRVICLEDEEDRFRMEFTDKAAKGIIDKKAAASAAEMFKGSWIDSRDKWGKSVRAYVIDEADRERYVERSVKANMTQLKKTWAEKAITGAKLRAIRALLGLKSSYTMAELKKGFAIAAVVFSPDYSDPMVRQMVLAQGLNSVGNMFGSPTIPVRKLEYDADPVYEPETDADLSNPAFTSEDPDEDIPANTSEPAQGQKQPMEAPAPERSREEDFQCSRCGAPINERVYEYSINKFGEPLCIRCQKGGGRR